MRKWTDEELKAASDANENAEDPTKFEYIVCD